jgi:glycosyltransferase 2 family protein
MYENRSKKSKIFQIALFAVSLGMLVYFCISDNNLVTLLYSLPNLNIFWLIGAMGCMVLNWMMDSLVTKNLVSIAYGESYSFKSAFQVTMVGQYFNSITPYAVAGQPMQLLAFTRQGVTSGIALSALVRKFLVYQTTITLFSVFAIVIKYNFFRSEIQGFMILAFIGLLSQAGIVVVLLLFTHSPKFTTKLIHGVVWLLTRLHIVKKPEETSEKVKNQLEFYIENNKAMMGNKQMRAKIYGCTLIQLTALFCVPFFIYKAFHNPGAPLVDMIAAQSFVTMISSYTPLPGAAGAAEGSFLVIFQIFFKGSIIRQAMLLWRLIAYYSCIVVGSFYSGLGDKRGKLKMGLAHGSHIYSKSGIRN